MDKKYAFIKKKKEKKQLSLINVCGIDQGGFIEKS
jgi:hypothetical protein